MSAKGMTTRGLLGFAKVMLGILLSIIFYLLVFVGISRMSNYVYGFSYQVFGNVSVQEAPGFDVDFVVNDGETIMQVADRLEHGKLIVNKYSFYIRAQLNSTGKGGQSIKPGSYELNTSMNYEEILNVITGMTETEEEA